MHNADNNPDLKKKTNVNVNDPCKTSGTSPPTAKAHQNLAMHRVLHFAFAAALTLIFLMIDPTVDEYDLHERVLRVLVDAYGVWPYAKALVQSRIDNK